MSSKFETFSEAEIAKIGQLVEALEKSSFDFLSLELAEFKLTVGKGGAAAEALAGAASASVPSAPATAPASAPAVAAPVATAPSPGQAGQPAPAPAAEEGLVDVIASTMGRFYSRPDPNSPPFVALGADVEADATVGLIEVMKLFNGVTAGVAGTVAQICVEDAQLVEFGQVLMRIRPAR